MSLDIHQESSLPAHLPLANVYSGLVKFDTVVLDKVVPDLAETWEASPDGIRWTFHLRKGVKWHDDKPFTAEDAKFSLERMAFPKEHRIVSPRGSTLLTAVKSVEAPDENTVRVTLKYPSASFITNAAAGWVFILPKHVIQAKGDMKKDVTGTGPFRWKSYSPAVVIELVKNPDYFIKGRPYLDGINIFSIKDDATRLAAFRTGRVKMTDPTRLLHAHAEMLRKEMADVAVVHTYPSFRRHLLLLNLGKSPWSDVRVRKAIDLALDRQAAIKINFNVGTLGAAMDPGSMWGIPEEEMKQRPGYRQPKDADIAEAKRLLVEAGYPKGFKTQMMLRAGGIVEQLGVVVKAQLARVGIEAELDVVELGVSTARSIRRAYEITPTAYADPVDDPDVVLGGVYVTKGGRNHGDFSDKQIDELYQQQAQTLDTAERKKIVRQMQERIIEIVPYPIMLWDPYSMAHWKEVKGYTPGLGVYSHNPFLDVWLAR